MTPVTLAAGGWCAVFRGLRGTVARLRCDGSPPCDGAGGSLTGLLLSTSGGAK